MLFSAVNAQTGAQVSTVRRLFDSLVCPILVYYSEMQGAFLEPKQLRNLESFNPIWTGLFAYLKRLGGKIPPHNLAIASQMTMKLGKVILRVEIFTN